MRLGGLSLGPFLRRIPIETWMACVVLVPVPLWFAIHVALDSGPAWRADYFADTSFGAPSGSVTERRMEHYWDSEHDDTPTGLDARTSSARYSTCIELDAARDVPVLLVGNGVGRFSLDGELRLSGESQAERWVKSTQLHLPAGVHHLSVELSARGWPSIGLLASFDGRAPTAIGSGKLASGVRTRLPAAGSRGCGDH